MGAQGLFAFFFLLNWGMITHTKDTDLLCLQHSGSALRQGLPEARVPQLSGHLRLATVLGPTGLPAGALPARPRVPGAQRRGSPAGARARRCSPAWGGGGPKGRGGPAGGRGFAARCPLRSRRPGTRLLPSSARGGSQPFCRVTPLGYRGASPLHQRDPWFPGAPADCGWSLPACLLR